MKKFKFTFIMLLLAIACVLFPTLNCFDKIEKIDASSVVGISGNKITLTGLVDTNPRHFFTDDNGNSTFINAKVKDCGGKYYSIVNDGSDDASGYSNYRAAMDMEPFFENGLIYAQATAVIKVDKGTNIKISLSSGDLSTETVSDLSDKGRCRLTTPMLKLSDINNDIKFMFEAKSDKKTDFQIDEPTIHIYTEINSVTLENANQEVTPGQMIKINAYNEVTKLTGQSGNFISYSKLVHKINFEFASGQEYVQIVGDSFIIKDDAPDGAEIKFRAYAKKNSYSDNLDDIIYSPNYVTFTVNSSFINVEVQTDFKNPATITGNGRYTENRFTTFSVVPNEGYNFLGWYVNGQFAGYDTTLFTHIHRGDNIYAKFTKDITIAALQVRNKVYDGTTEIDMQDVSVLFDGVEEGHQVGLGGLSCNYVDANVGANKVIMVDTDNLALDGENCDLYVLKSKIIPTSYGEIVKRDAFVTPNNAQKQYGNVDPILTFTATNLVEGQSLTGNLGRAEGEQLGEYAFNLGNLIENNPNYNIILKDNNLNFEIVRRVLNLEGINVAEKVYDGTTTATITARLNNIFNNEDVDVKLVGHFVSSQAGYSAEAKITQFELTGADKNNYTLQEYTQPIYGNILKRELTITATDCTFVYGENIDLNYKVDGLLDFDNLSGKLSIDDNHVGTHKIEIGNLNNPNYQINFVGANCEIVKRTAYVNADSQTKIYGDADPTLTYSTTNMVNGDVMSGGLIRVEGEDVASYSILQGDLFNPNYDIIFTGNILEITKREITVNIEFLDKEYDGSDKTYFNVTYSNNVKNVDFNLELDSNLEGINCGVCAVNVNSIAVVGEEKNYSFIYSYKNLQIVVSRREVTISVDHLTKEYGEADPEFSYSAKNVVDGENLVGKISRNAGENAGKYSYYLDTLNNYTNPNYNISLVNSYFEIKPKQLRLDVPTKQKYFGELDPEFEYSLITELAFDEKQQDIFSGFLSRQAGEYVGVYLYDVSNLSAGDNYTLVVDGDANFIINKRPVTVEISSASKVYGEDDPAFEYVVHNEVEGESLNLQIRREYGEDVGTYQLICANTNDSRYIIDDITTSAFLTISPTSIGIKADDSIKVYGDADPTFNFIITSGVLKNNDRLEDIVSGTMARDKGEKVGFYTVYQGDFSLGKNYDIQFETGNLEIIQKEITIYACATSKTYGESDPELTYSFGDDELVFGDVATGSLKREQGEQVGRYKITQGDVCLNDNYLVAFETDYLVINPKPIEVVPNNLSKQYGDDDTPLTYTIIGDLINGDTLAGELYRDVGFGANEEVGKYKIHSNLFNQNYNIVLKDYYFTILPREIVVEADGPVVITYGDPEPELTYHIVSGTLLDGDTIKGQIYREAGSNARSYNIISSLNINKNYNIIFVKSTVEILPKNITIKSKDYQKIYGQNDPDFEYEIVEGELINDDILYGNLSRAYGEDVGEYSLVCGVYNSNYKLTLLDAKLTIVQKDAYLITQIYDKIYDGNTRAKLRNPYISGVIDENVYLSFDEDNCAEFKSGEVGKDIAVTLHDISLTGDKSKNYHLVIPSNLTANITNRQMVKNEVTLSTDEANLFQDYALNVTSSNIDNNTFKIKNQQSCLMIKIWVEKENKQVDVNGQFTINIKLSSKIYDNSNIYVYQKMSDGEVKLVSSRKGENGNLIISSSELGEFYITTANDNWIDYAAYVASGFIVIIICLIGIKLFRRKKKSDKN